MNVPARLRFSKMHGAGNDFVILDQRSPSLPLTSALAARLAERHRGIGCDQVITIEAPRSAQAAAAYRIWNADGSAAAQCGNGARCVAAWLHREGAARACPLVLDSPAGPVEARWNDDWIAVRLGTPDFNPASIPLREQPGDPYRLESGQESIHFGAVSLGNPHAVLEVSDLAGAEVARLSPILQQHPFFPVGCNVGFAQILAPDRIRLRVYEQGAGETLACGSGACAAVAVLGRRGRVAAEVAVELPGGILRVSWAGAGHPIWLTGPAEFVFEGEFIL